MLPIRSLLFTPGNKREMIGKAIHSGADSVILDLEDAVPVEEKETAREVLASLPSSNTPIFVRINGFDTDLKWQDLQVAVRIHPAGIVLPKSQSVDELTELAGALSMLESAHGLPQESIGIIPVIETATGVVRVREIAQVRRVQALFFGSGERGDLVADLECEWTPEGTALLHARSECLLAARAAGHETVIDGVFMDIRNGEGFRRECLLARRLGYTAKALIHPNQIQITHEVFTPSPEEVAEQRRILNLFEEALARGSGTVAVDGKMIDYAVARVAERIIRRAEVAEQAERQSGSDSA